MPDLEQNMDELFRKAAENYPLRVNESKWDEIAPCLLTKPQHPATDKKRIYRKYISLFLLFISLLLVDGIMTTRLKTGKTNQLNPSFIENKTRIPATNQVTDYAANELADKKISRPKHDDKKTTTHSSYSVLSFGNKIIQSQVTGNKERRKRSSYTLEAAMVQLNPLKTFGTGKISNTITACPENLSPLPGKNIPEETPELTKNAGTKKETLDQPGIYYGAMAGPLVDKVKNQGLKKTGFSIGIIAGYKFKNHFSAETGILFAKKPYFSIGKYFNMDKMDDPMPAGMKIISLEGNNSVLEIPVKVKYDFLYRNKSNFFSSVGITSYIMTHEKNNYLVSMSGSQQTMISSYKNESRSLASTFDISAGYEHRTGKFYSLRIEPYIQIPLKGVGVGAIPMISSGLRIGITKFTN